LIEALTRDYGDCAGFSETDREIELSGFESLKGLADVFGLDDLAIQLLLIAAVGDLDANIALGYDLLTGRTGVGRPTVGLALELAEVPTADPTALTCLGPASALREGALLDVVGDGPWLFRNVRIADRVVWHLSGAEIADPSVVEMTTPVLALPGAASAEIARVFAAGAGLVWVRSPLGAAGAAIAAGAFADLGLACLAIDLRRWSAQGPLTDAVARAVREAALRGLGLVVSGADVLSEPDARAGLRVLNRSPVPVVAVGMKSWNPDLLAEPILNFEAIPMSVSQRTALWRDLLGELPDEPGRVELMSLRLTPEDVAATSHYARLLSEARAVPLSVDLVRDAARERSAAVGAGSGRVSPRSVTTPPTFDDLVLPERTLAELRRLVAWAAHRDEVLARGPVYGKGGRGTGISAMFAGSPGTGKTLAAHVIAAELNLELFQVELSGVIDKYIGETEKNLERIFHEAESRNVVLFFDEADSLFGSRSEVRDARDRYANQEVSYLLQRIEHFDGITILATNLRGNLDKAFSRRMNFIVQFLDPDTGIRQRLWRQHLDQAGDLDPADPIDDAALAAWSDLSGGDIRNIVLSATYDATSRYEALGMRHLREAAVREYQKLARRVPDILTERTAAPRAVAKKPAARKA